MASELSSGSGAVSKTEPSEVHPFPSVAVTAYTPAGRPSSCGVADPFDQA